MQQNTISIMEAWPATLFFCDWADHPRRAPGITKYIKDRSSGFSKTIESGVATSSKSAEGLIESPLDFFDTADHPDVQALSEWTRNCVRAAVSKVNGDQIPPSKLNVNFNESWFHITNDGGFHDAHVHGNCSWCGIYYLAAGDPDVVPADGTDKAGNGVNRFYAHIPTGGMADDFGSAYLRRSYIDVQPIEGRMIVFPSFLLHSALPYKGKNDRIILSFNSQTFMG